MSKFIFSLLLLLGVTNVSALTKFPAGTCEFEGHIFKPNGSNIWAFVVNPNTNSSTIFYFPRTSEIKGLKESGQNRIVRIKINKETFSSIGEAEFIEVVDMVNPYERIKFYINDRDVSSVCSGKSG